MKFLYILSLLFLAVCSVLAGKSGLRAAATYKECIEWCGDDIPCKIGCSIHYPNK